MSDRITSADAARLEEWKELDEAFDDEAPVEGSDATPAPVESSTAPADQPPVTPAPPADPAAVVEPPGQPDPAPAPPAPATSPAPPVTADPSTTETPYALRADGRELAIPGVVKLADGSLKIPAQSFNALAMHLADRTAIREKVTEYHRQLAEQAESLQAATTSKDHLLDLFQQVLAMTPEERDRWCEEKQLAFPQFVAESRERELQSREARLRQQEEEAEFKRRLPELEPQWQQGLVGYVQRMCEQDGVTGLDPAQVAQVAWAWKDHGLLVRAPQDIPETGTRKGQMAVALPLLRQIIHQEARNAAERARLRAEWEAEQARRQQVAKATAINAAAQARPQTPPTVAATGGRTVRVQERSQPRRADGTFAKKDESDAGTWERELMSADLTGD